jgi:polysaccharide export outer membrane protein
MYRLVFLVFISFILFSCSTLNRSVMLRTAADYKFESFSTIGPDSVYKIAPNDILNFRLITNEGENLVASFGSSGGQQAAQGQQGIVIPVEFDGTAKFPLVGRLKIEGKTRREAEDFLEDKYSLVKVDPYITLSITNRKVIVFPGTGNNAQIIDFTGDNMNLIEALARVGGISNTGKSKNIKLIRGDLSNPKVYKIDLSTIDGMKQADLVLQAGDIIYVDPYENPAELFTRNVTPYIGVISMIATVATTVALIISLGK